MPSTSSSDSNQVSFYLLPPKQQNFNNRGYKKLAEELYRLTQVEEDYVIPELDGKFGAEQIINLGLCAETVYIIGSGKEATVYMARDNQGELVAIKLYRIYRTAHRSDLLDLDGNVSGARDKGTQSAVRVQAASILAMQEYDMLVELYDKGVPLPMPYEQKDFAYSMELLGSEIGPSPLLKEVNLLELGLEPIEVLEDILDIYYKMFTECHIAHADFNEHNLIWHNNRIFVIDVLQARKYNSNNISPFASKGNYISKIEAYELLERDITSIMRHFRQKYSVSFDTKEVIELMMDLQDEDSLWYQTFQYIHGERHFSR